MRRDPPQERHQLGEAAPQQRLAAGEAQLGDAHVGERPDQGRQLVEGQEVLARQPGVVLLRHAVGAPEVAPVGHRQPQIPQRPTPLVHHAAGDISGTGASGEQVRH